MQARNMLSLLAFVATTASYAGHPLQQASAESAQIMGAVVEGPAVTSVASVLLARLQLASGADLKFLALDTGVGIVEVAPAGSSLLSDTLIERWNATPLEIFLALAPPSSLAPAALQRDHARRTRVPARTLTVPVAYGVPIDNFDCDPPQNFEEDWFDTYDGVTSHVVSESYEDFGSAQYDWYPGAHVYYGTGDNLVTHLGICNADENTSFSVEIHRKVTHATDGDQQSSWHKLVSASIGYNGRFTFHTNLPGSYRQRLIATSGTPIEQLAAGAAYTKSPKVGVILK